jgi:hypothetical protein
MPISVLVHHGRTALGLSSQHTGTDTTHPLRLTPITHEFPFDKRGDSKPSTFTSVRTSTTCTPCLLYRAPLLQSAEMNRATAISGDIVT